MIRNLSEESITLLDKPLNAIDYVVFDFETTGINPELGDRIIEIGAVKIKANFRISKSKFHRLIKTNAIASKSSFDVHGISEDELLKGCDECVAIYDFIDFARGCVLVAHNASKDIAFLRHSLKDYLVDNPFEIFVDTLSLSRKLFPLASGHSLDAITERYRFKSVTGFKRHRALYDAEITALFFRFAVKKLFRNQCFSLFELLEFLKRR
jgi:DNA polymerase III epsilon subunit family exonuclease